MPELVSPSALDSVAPIGTEQMMREELALIRGITTADTPDRIAERLRTPASALCFSGGGIRSAAFNLGVARSLARRGLLKQFDYLSTVSGGGFIGGWLQVLIKEQPDSTHAARVTATETALAEHEPEALTRLRDHTNYLTPDTGFASADTWAGVALYLRNLILNWFVLLPVMLLVVLLPVFHRTFIWQVGERAWATWSLMAIAWIGLSAAVFLSCRALPSHVTDAERKAQWRPLPESGLWRQSSWRQRLSKPGLMDATLRTSFRRDAICWIVGLALFWAFIAPACLQRFGHLAWVDHLTWVEVLKRDGYLSASEPVLPPWEGVALLAGYLGAMLLGYIAAWVAPGGTGTDRDRSRQLYPANKWRWLCASIGSTILLAIGIFGLAIPRLSALEGDATLITLLVPLGLVLVFLFQTALFTGLRKEALFSDLDREWMARLNGIILGIAVAWTLFAFCCVLLGSMLSKWTVSDMSGPAASVAASGGLAAWLGRKASSWAQDAAKNPAVTNRIMTHLPALLSAASLLLLLIVLSWGLQESITKPVQLALPSLAWLANGWAGLFDRQNPTLPAGWLHVAAQLVLFGLLLLMILRGVKKININRFSMHGVYRNRIVRAFLGTAKPRDSRNPDWFTGIDPNDDVPLKSLANQVGEGQMLFPVVNMTLNLSVDERRAWAERKGASFIATPLRCGADALSEGGCFVPSGSYAGSTSRRRTEPDNGVPYGAMITTSGAAASPHWGYHTSPLTAFVMTLFNVRLGLWLANPAQTSKSEWRLARPPDAIGALLGDLLGRTRRTSKAIYLSDGGHFENLGLYEMLRRRCDRIVVIDAGQDANCEFFDLGNAIRKAEIDLPVRVTMRTMRILPRAAIEKSGDAAKAALGIAVGDIEYLHDGRLPEPPPGDAFNQSIADARRAWGTGTLIYIKPSFLPDIPAAARAYGLGHNDFPHESTTDQWFSESQFESYQTLGHHQADKITEGTHDLAQLFASADRFCPPPVPAAARQTA